VPSVTQHLERLERSLVAHTDGDISDDVPSTVTTYAQWVLSQHDLDLLVYRTLDARLLLDSSEVDAGAFLSSRLTPPERGRVCLVLRYPNRLANAAHHGVQSATQALRILHEHLARWDEANLLVVENPSARAIELFPQTFSTDFDDTGGGNAQR
jgi:hypothetical protein